jgi:hypothetical protein
MGRSKINRINRVIKGGTQSTSGSINIDPTGSDSGGWVPIPQKPKRLSPADLGLGEPTSPTKPTGPGTTVLSDEDKLIDEFVEQIDDALGKEEEWNRGRTDQGGTYPGGSDGTPVDGYVENDLPDVPEDRIWDMGQLEDAIDQASRDGVEEERKSDSRENRTRGEKTKGGKGTGGIRDRIEIEVFSKTNWGKIFRTRLNEYSKEASKYIPYHRRFASNKTMRTRIPSKTRSKDTIPELNLIIDTSSSLSYAELEVILAEVQGALSEAKITKINLILWTGTPYHFKQFTNINKRNFNTILNNIKDNWVGGGNDVTKVYELMKEKGITKKFTLHLTDGWIRDHFRDDKTKRLSNDALDPNNTIFGIIFPTKRISVEEFSELKARFPGEKVPIFLDTDRFK